MGFKVIGFYTRKNDPAHVRFVHEANHWFVKTADKCKFSYDSNNYWDNLNPDFLTKYDIVLFLDARPDKAEQLAVYEQNMNGEVAWIGFHFAAFALKIMGVP